MSQKVSIDERRRLVAQSLQVGNPGNNARDLPGQADALAAEGQFEHQIELTVDEIRPYEHNPRRSVNVKFDDIKESIRTSGVRSPLTVTRRPGESHSDTNDPGEFTDFASRNEDRIAPEGVRMLEPTDLVQLPKGQAFALLHGGQLHKIRMPLPSAEDDPLMPESLAAIGLALRKRLDGPWNLPDEDWQVERDGG